MIEFKQGDMFATEADIRVNTVNCVGAMGAGVALAFKRRYPEMFKTYQADCKSGNVRPGEMHIWKSLAGDWIINFPTKRDWKEPSRYEDIESGLLALRKYLSEQGAVSVALPALGCGNGGLDWAKVSKMIERELGELDAHIMVFAPSASRSAGSSAETLPTGDEISSARQLGFEPLAEQFAQELRVSSAVFYRGELKFLNQKWIGLIPSKSPDDRELQAILSTATTISEARPQTVIALLLNNKSSEELALNLREKGVDTLLVLPFGILTRKSISWISSGTKQVAYISSAPPSDRWSRKNFSTALNLLLERSTATIVSDPSPEWLVGKNGQPWRKGPLFFVNYGQLQPAVRSSLLDLNAMPISKEASSGKPKINALLDLLG